MTTVTITRSNSGLNLTPLSQEQADYIKVPLEGPYKPDYYRY